MAADFTTQVAGAAGRITASWSPERAAAVLRGIEGRQRRQRQRRTAGALAMLLVLVVLSPRIISALRGTAVATHVASAPQGSPPLMGTELGFHAPPLQLRDGSVVRPQGKASQLRLREDRPGRTVIELAGAAQFEVVHDPQRLFRVETRGLAVEVLGTRFLVEEQGPRVHVTVQEGRVRVLWASHYDELNAGQSTWFQPEPPGDLGLAAGPGGLPPLDEPAPGPKIAEPTATASTTTALHEEPLPPTGTAGPRPASSAPMALREEPLPPRGAAGLGSISSAPAVLREEPVLPTEAVSLGSATAASGSRAPVVVAPTPAVAAATTAPPRAKPQRGGRPESVAPATATSAAVVSVAPPEASEPSSWQTLAHEGLFEQAYRVAYGAADAAAHHAAEPQLLRAREVAPGELLLLADVARLSHHPADAMAPLSRLLNEHAADPRAPLAAFTLGRVLLDDLGRPREAAQSFLRVQQLDPDGPLSQDALAREVEAWSRAGEAASARTRALLYVQKYPAGRRLRSVRHFGELL